MSTILYFERIERIDQLIRQKATGTPKELANKLNISERSLYNVINEMRGMGASISYCKIKKSYMYDDDIRFEFGFKNGN